MKNQDLPIQPVNTTISTFEGFSEGKIKLVRLPEQFFSELLDQFDHLEELKLILYIFWHLEQMEGSFRCFRVSELYKNTYLLRTLSKDSKTSESILKDALTRAIKRGVVLQIPLSNEEDSDALLFLNSAKGRAGYKAYLQGKWKPENIINQSQIDWLMEQPNIYQLYEENIGPLTPLIADALRDAEASFPQPWIQEAIKIAAERNKRSWSYILAVLRHWQEEGRDEENRRDATEIRRKYIEGEFSDFIEH